MAEVKISSFPRLTDPDDIRAASFVGYVDSGGTSSARYTSSVFEQALDIANTTGLLDLTTQVKTGSILDFSSGGTSASDANGVVQTFLPASFADEGKQIRYNNSLSYPYLEWSDEYPVSLSLLRFSTDPNFNRYQSYAAGGIISQEVKSGIGWPTSGSGGIEATFSFPFNVFCKNNTGSTISGTWNIRATLVVKGSSSNTYTLALVRTRNTSLVTVFTSFSPTQNYPSSGETIFIDMGHNTSTLSFERYGLYLLFSSGTSSQEMQVLSAQITLTRNP
jgi:hypothetical protein